jgi:arabinofuranosyltransferase
MSPQARRVTLASIAVVALAYAALVWSRRWMSDDGLIVLRTVRNILDGNGPTFNAFERAEANTSALWTYLLVVARTVTRLRLEYVAVYLGLLLSVAGIVLGMDGTRRLLRARGSSVVIVPAGAFVMIGVFPFWDYGTSGLESGLCFAWVGLCWWMLAGNERVKLSAFVFGLGPLVRPDLAIASIVFFVALWLVHRPPWKRTLVLAAIGVALPLAYEIFRAGYYGTLVPLPALAKSATDSEWSRGFGYLRDYNHPYVLWVPLAAVGALFAYVMRKRLVGKRELIVIAAPIATAVLDAIYVLRVGGDFMHARMLLVPTFALLLPAFVLPVRRFTVAAIAVLAGWAVTIAIATGDGESHVTGDSPLEDERVGYVLWTHHRNPIRGQFFVDADRPGAPLVRNALRAGERLLISHWGYSTALGTAHDAQVVYAVGRLGTGGYVVPLDAIAADTLGLANPLGARIPPTLPGYTGHEKLLPWAWVQADFGDPARDHDHLADTSPIAIGAARRAMQCGELAELLASVRAPMTPSRFWRNLTGSWRRTRLVIPDDPIEAEQTFCGATTLPRVLVSSEYRFEGWWRYGLVDGVRSPEKSANGHTSRPTGAQHTEWIELRYTTPRLISKVALYPSWGAAGFPVDFQIQTWDGARWVTRVTQTSFARPDGPREFVWSPGDTTDRIRLLATKLAQAQDGGYVLQLAEIETL